MRKTEEDWVFLFKNPKQKAQLPSPPAAHPYLFVIVMLKPGSSQCLSHPSVGHIMCLSFLGKWGLMAIEYSSELSSFPLLISSWKGSTSFPRLLHRWPWPWPDFWNGRENNKIMLPLFAWLGGVTCPVQREGESKLTEIRLLLFWVPYHV